METIYNTREEAKAACEEYQKKLYELQDSLGITETFHDECAPVYISAKYLDKNKEIQVYTY